MARSRSGFYSTIEYIGPRPQKPKKQNFFGGWVIVAIAIGAGIFFGKPLISGAWASDNGPTSAESELIVKELSASDSFGDQLAAEALRYSDTEVLFDPAYFQINYPGGDVPASKGVAADLVIRCYRKLGVDLQEKIHEDMAANYRRYPDLWASSAPDTNIDHRRVPNLQRFFNRNATSVEAGNESESYKAGDVVVWTPTNVSEMHVGIVVPGPSGEGSEPWVVHHLPSGIKWEKAYFKDVLGHFRYPAE
ncbi:DUF1287 domain-containing protein [Luteolibacter sp. AS25]|uniref:DUF1287 domain-containing protein n=1 Tax=Luteolibacter sp. AS25 TaxID=3135776 RepID=UPI00398BA33D